MADVTFLGACGVVTGSSTLLRFGDTRILVDCGLYQGDEETEHRNRLPFGFRPPELTAVVVTHAHLDHTGLLPKLVAEGYDGPIFCTRPTRPLASLLLEDSAGIQEEEARYARKKGYSRHADPRPLYTGDDARHTTRLLQTVPFDEERDLGHGIRIRFRRAGHLLGAASVEISAKGSDGERRSWCFSGDIGRYGVPILKDPEPPLAVPEAVLLESTYGDRLHTPENAEEMLERVIGRTFARGGMVIVPAFALGRAQEVLYYLSRLAERGVVDPRDVFLDSPMAISATELYERSASEHDEELRELDGDGRDPLDLDRFQRVRTSEQSKQLNSRTKPAVIVAASGMAEGGRVVHHLLHRLPDPRTSVLFVGYQAPGTRGSALVGGADTVGIHGLRVPVAADILYERSLSAHGDRNELLRWAKALPGVPNRVFLNHGEDPARKALAAELLEIGWPRPVLPSSGTRVPW
jgi:metallo-beta-lactamase family protein